MTIESFIRTGLIFCGVFVVLLIVLHFTDNTEALATCQASHSLDVCELTLNP